MKERGIKGQMLKISLRIILILNDHLKIKSHHR